MFDVYSSQHRVRVGEVEIAVTDHGASDAEAVLMIHGFPDSARLWRNQVPAVVDAGYRAIAPDVRGFGRSDKPEDVSAYQLSVLAADMVAVLDNAGVEAAHVVGHDWGAAIAWYLAIASPERVRSLVALSVGHPSAFLAAGFEQLEKSWYMLLFQFQPIAEQWLSENDWHNLRTWARYHGEIDHWIDDLSRKGALTAALAPYRANLGPDRLLAPPRSLPPVQTPVMGVWSSGDMALLEKQMVDSEKYLATEWRYENIDGASHWIPIDAPEPLNELLTNWIADH